MTTTAVQTRRQTGYDADNRCTTCGEHIADPHAPGCPWDDVERDLADAARLSLLEAASFD